MVILIGGASCTGKTTMAQRLLEKYNITYMSIDHLKMGLIRGNRYCDFTALDPEDELTEKLWPIVEGIIKTNIENDQHIIIEGCYLPTDKIKSFDSKYADFIVPIYIGFSENYINRHFEDGIIGNRSETEYKDIDPYISRGYFITAHKTQKKRCIQDGLNFFEINDDYHKDMTAAYGWLDQMVNVKKKMKYNKENKEKVSV